MENRIMFYTFHQNNSGGSFHFDEKAGITHYVIIEASSANAVEARAEDIGLYFDGCENGQDCDCCGDRWYRPYEKGLDKPVVYGNEVGKSKSLLLETFWSEFNRKECCIHYMDGSIEWVECTSSRKDMKRSKKGKL